MNSTLLHCLFEFRKEINEDKIEIEELIQWK